MEINQQNLAALEGYLNQTLSPDPKIRKQAESFLFGVESQQNYPLLILKLVEIHSDLNTKTAAAILFKNYVRRNWAQEDETSKIHASDREGIKNLIVSLMINSPPMPQKQLNEALAIIADHDFPDHWPNLLPDLISKIQIDNPVVMNGILQTAQSIFKRYRTMSKTTESMGEMQFVLRHFTGPFLEITKVTDRQIEANAQNKQNLNLLFPNLFLIVRIFHHLNYLDLPEFFEVHMDDFMGIFSKYLTYNNPLLASDSDDQAGHLEKVRAAICEAIALYTTNYEEEFTKYLPNFVQTVWTLLTSVGPQARNDVLVSTAIKFLSSVARHQRHRGLFSNADTLKSICEKIVIPNMEFRDSDEEDFEDTPMDYVRKDLEGSDVDTRRRAASDFVKILCNQFEQEVTSIFSTYVNVLLAEHKNNPKDKWKSKDTAISLVIALAVKTSVQTQGATATNSLVNIGDFFQSFILPSLQSDANAEVPLLKADAIKFLYTFRSQIPKEFLLGMLPLLTNHLKAKDTVVKTYAAVCIERILSLRVNRQLVVNPADLKPHLQAILGNLFDILEAKKGSPQQLAENDYVMKTIMRAVSASKEEMGPYTETVLAKLTQITMIISKNPSNPKFNHFLFEANGALVKFISASNPGAVTSFEAFLFPPFKEIIDAKIDEFMPYVFQILSQLLELNKKDAVSPNYQNIILPKVLSADTWESPANIPPLVRLLCAFLTKAPQMIISLNKFEDILGIFQKLVASKSTDQEGFAVLNTIILSIPHDKFAAYLKHVLVILLTRLQGSKTSKFVTGLITFICTYSAVAPQGAKVIFETLEGVQPGLSKMLVGSVIVPEVQKVSGHVDRKTCAVGITLILTQCPTMLLPTHFDTWSMLLVALVKLFELPEEDANEEENEEEAFANAGLAVDEFQVAYNQLVFANQSEVDPVPHVPDAKLFLPKALATFAQANPGKIGPVLVALPDDVKVVLANYFTRAQVDINSIK